jgi:uncharacterized membrane protein
MMLRSYRRRLHDDLVRWTAAGLIQPDQAAAIRRDALAENGGSRLIGVLAMLGGLLLAAGVAAFIAANWQAIPRPAKVIAIMALVLAGLGAWSTLQRDWARGGSSGPLPLPADAAATFAALCFGAGVALVGQMYHLPADWLAGTLTVTLGALLVALLTRSDGAFIVALIGVCVWGAGVTVEGEASPPLAYGALVLASVVLALPRERRSVQHAAILTLGLWLALLPGVLSDARLPAMLAWWLGVGVSFTALGLLAEERGGPQLAAAALPWGVFAVGVVGLMQLFRILEATASRAGEATALAVVAGLAALASIGALLAFGRERRANGLMALALIGLLALPVVFWSGLGVTGLGRVLVGALVLLAAVLMVLAGGALGQRRIVGAGVGLFAVAVLVLLYRTVGSLVDQSLFFLVGGALLVAVAAIAARVMKRRAAVQPGGGSP